MTAYIKHSAPELLNKAAAIMDERGKQYDKPEGERSMAQTVAIFNLHHGLGMTEAQGWHFMQILKDVRLFQNPGYHQDSAEDCIAYAALKAEAKQTERCPNQAPVPAFLTRDVANPIPTPDTHCEAHPLRYHGKRPFYTPERSGQSAPPRRP